MIQSSTSTPTTNDSKKKDYGSVMVITASSIATGTTSARVGARPGDDSDVDDVTSAVIGGSGQSNYNSNSTDRTHGKEDEEENMVRKRASHNALYLVLVNAYSAVVIFALHLISMESVVSIALSAGLTVYCYRNQLEQQQVTLNPGAHAIDGAIMNWILLTFAVVTPISETIKLAFGRRERALLHVATLRSTLLELYSAHALWDWGSGNEGRSESSARGGVDWLEHADAVAGNVVEICRDLVRWFTLPTWTRARHKMTVAGRREAEKTNAAASATYGRILRHLCRISQRCEVLKREGLPPNEATRIRQWERIALQQIESLRMLKSYRTPQALRSFGRVFSVCLPPFYAPYYAQLAVDVNSLGMGVTFSVITALALTALFETISQLEDPFCHASVLDGIHVHDELLRDFVPRIATLRSEFFPDAVAPEVRVNVDCDGSAAERVVTARFLGDE